MQPCQVHLDHALPLLPELGLEHLVPLLAGGGQVELDASSLQELLRGIAKGAGNRSLRRFVAIAKTPGEEVFAWEADPALESQALREAALLPWKDSMQAVLDFFLVLRDLPERYPGLFRGSDAGTGDHREPRNAGRILRRLLAPGAGGWRAAALLPLHDALSWAEEALRERRWQAHERAIQVWASTLPAYAMGGTPPDPPEPPED